MSVGRIKETARLMAGIASLIFFGGFFTLFGVYQIRTDQINEVGFVAFNVPSLNGSQFFTLVYVISGIAQIFFCIAIFILFDGNFLKKIAVSLFFVAACVWVSFGLVDYEYEDAFGIQFLLIRVFLLLALISFGLILFGVDFFSESRRSAIDLLSLLAGAASVILGLLSLFVLDDATWIRTNICIVIYFAWLGSFVFSAGNDNVSKSSSGR